MFFLIKPFRFNLEKFEGRSIIWIFFVGSRFIIVVIVYEFINFVLLSLRNYDLKEHFMILETAYYNIC